jgi:predicted metalloprotease
MKWQDWRRSENVEDRRGQGGGGGGRIPGGRGGLGIGTVLVLSLIGYALGIDPRILIGGAEIITAGGGGQVTQQQQAPNNPAMNDETRQFVSAVLAETEDRWGEIFNEVGQRYRPPGLVLFSGATRSACGTGRSEMGPFYCPNDEKVYLDAVFFRELQTRFRACQAGSRSCEFSYAYVIAHEVGHHVQNKLGILPRVQQAQRGMGEAEANQLQVRVELQADCFAGIWANRSQKRWNFLEQGDIEAALQTAAAIGDDMLQRRAQGYVVPDSFTHGSSEQRQRWFTNGFRSGQVSACDTFAARQP